MLDVSTYSILGNHVGCLDEFFSGINWSKSRAAPAALPESIMPPVPSRLPANYRPYRLYPWLDDHQSRGEGAGQATIAYSSVTHIIGGTLCINIDIENNGYNLLSLIL